MDIENRDTLLNALGNKVNLFLGAGFSVLAKDQESHSLPIGNSLADELRSEFNPRNSQDLDLQKLCTVINATNREALRNYLKRRFTIGEFDDRYRVLDRLSIDTIFTTNIDNLVHRAFEDSKDKYINDIDFNGPVYHDKSAVELVMLHGSVLRDDRPMRFGKLEVASSFGADPNRWRELQSRLKRSPILFWGYSLEDPAPLEALTPHAERGGGESRAWIIVHPSSRESGIIDYYRALNLQIIVGDTADFLGFLATNFAARRVQEVTLASRDTRTLFPGESVPYPGDVFVRPIQHFFRGAAPVWSDIFSGALYRTSQFGSVRESVYAGKQTIITGVPVCGKTTLLMQLAAELDFNGHKLVVDKLTEEKAQLIVRKLGAERALVFVDNYTDDAFAFAHLASSPSVRIVGADQDYSVSNTMHLISRENFKFIDVTGLNDRDLQNVRETIPEPIRGHEFKYPQVTAGIRPSLFEFIQANSVSPTLFERVEEALRELRHDSPLLSEMLLFVSYVHHCLTPVSMDMAIAYWRDRVSDFEEIYKMFAKVGASIAEYAGELATEPQDYFAARSTLVADTVLHSVDRKSLREMLSTFHRNLGPFQICHYRIFSRHAYDYQLFARAFPDWEQGRSFYDEIYENDPSPYILQHAALYLSERDRHSEAFNYIDRALAQAGTYNWTIRNSHAIILFRANIEFWQERSARETLDSSMSILSRCYHSDRRRAIHAMVFADHAIKYYNKYRDEKAQEYLLQAKKWLAEQKELEPWLDRIEPLEKQVNSRLNI